MSPKASFGFENLCDNYNSETGIFTRRYSFDTLNVKIFLTQEERELVLKSFSDNDFGNLPTDIDCSSWGASPKIYDKLFLDGGIVNYAHNGENVNWGCVSGKRFCIIYSVLTKIILNKNEIKKLEPSDIYYE